jgi:hypothetical protein
MGGRRRFLQGLALGAAAFSARWPGRRNLIRRFHFESQRSRFCLSLAVESLDFAFSQP